MKEQEFTINLTCKVTPKDKPLSKLEVVDMLPARIETAGDKVEFFVESISENFAPSQKAKPLLEEDLPGFVRKFLA